MLLFMGGAAKAREGGGGGGEGGRVGECKYISLQSTRLIPHTAMTPFNIVRKLHTALCKLVDILLQLQ